MKRYEPKAIEPKWQQIWADTKLYAAKDNDPREKYYYLVEFPYPSGEGLHVGHVLSFTALDIMARHKRMQGYNVLYPMGFDEFGLPTENYAIKHKIAPQVATEKNVNTFRRQMRSLGLSFDWDREVNTSNPDYYKWTQWIFLKLYEAGLAYQDEIAINWCPFEKTGLANEEVVDGKHERCGTPVEKKLLKQWLLRITAYADRLIDDLKTVDYLDRIASQQINWIGRSEGAEIDFVLNGLEAQLTVYTTRPDTIFGASFLVASPEVVRGWMNAGWTAPKDVDKYVTKAINTSELQRQEEKVKTGVDTGVKAVHPLTADQIPVWVADYVLGSYGTGAIMAVPGHDERDHEFAEKFGLPIKTVVEPVLTQTTGSATFRADEPVQDSAGVIALIKHWQDDTYLGLEWPAAKWGTLLTGGIDDGLTAEETVLKEIIEETGYKHARIVRQLGVIHSKYYHEPKQLNRFGHAPTFYVELSDGARDEVSAEEQAKHKIHWLTKAELTRFLTATSHVQALELFDNPVFTGEGLLVNSGEFDGLESDAAKTAIVKALETKGAGKGATKYKLRDWIFSRQHYWGEPIPIIHCAHCGVVPVPADQLPVTLPVVESYEPTDTGESPLANITDWVNVNCPKCGAPAKRETDTMPNWAGSSWYYLRYTDAHNDEAFASPQNLKYWTPVDLYNGGMEHTTLHLLYSRFWHKFLYDQGLVPTAEPYARRRSHGMILGPDGVKMSKSRGNVINPDHVVAKYGADTIRVYEMFMGPYDEMKIWSEEHLAGVSRFVYRVWNLVLVLTGEQKSQESAGTANEVQPGVFETEVDRTTHKTLKRVHEDVSEMHFNTAVSALMEYVNFLNAPERLASFANDSNTALAKRTARALVLMLAPFAPHLTEELWHEALGEEGSVHAAAWPAYDPELIKDDLVTIVVQVNGKVRANLVAPVDATEAELTELAKADANVAKYFEGAEIVKTIVVPRRLVNFVVKP